jgi:hypothetical protein
MSNCVTADEGGCEIFCITTTDVAAKQLREMTRVYVVGESNREHLFQGIWSVDLVCSADLAGKGPMLS